MAVLPTFDMMLFGGTGDLVTRKLLPALYRRYAAGQVSEESRIVGIARGALSRAEYAAQAQAACREFLGKEFDSGRWERFCRLLHYLRINAAAEADYAQLTRLLEGRDEIVRVFFFSTASNLFSVMCDNLAKARVVTAQSRVVLEKPLGHDTASADLINAQVGAAFAERQIYRIDHYLGKETVQNLMALRFGNALFEPLWRRGLIKHVQITVAEELGVERRGNFYDQTGALRDMVQNHLLQLLCIMAMEPPASSDPDAVRDEKLKVLRALRPLRDGDVLTKTVRGQYKAGAVRGVPVPGYLEEADIAPDSTTETFAALKVEIDTWRWAGVPFYLRTGKRLQDRITELVVTFDDVPHPIFEKPRVALRKRAGDPTAARREHHAHRPRQESGRGNAAQARQPRARSRRDLQDPEPGCLRAVADGYHKGQSHIVHAPRRARCGLALDRPHPGGMGAVRRAAQTLYRGELGTRFIQCLDQPRRILLA